jgi:hypothetical protein
MAARGDQRKMARAEEDIARPAVSHTFHATSAFIHGYFAR